MNKGLRKLPIDERDFKSERLGGIFEQLILPEGNFIVGMGQPVRHQGNTDRCTAYSTCLSSGFQEGKVLNPDYTFYKSRYIAGLPINAWGCDNRSACKSHVKYGALEQEHAPHNNELNEFILNPNNWDDVYDINAEIHKKKTFMTPTGGKDLFDSIRGSMYKYGAAVVTGAMWRGEWNITDGIIPEEYGDSGFGHSFAFIGQRIIKGQPFLVAQNSYGEGVGENGLFFFSREVVNKECEYGNYFFKDLTEEEVNKLKNPSWCRMAWEWIKNNILI